MHNILMFFQGGTFMNTLTAKKRDLKTKAKKLRKEGYVIGNLFGRDIENSIPLKVDSREAAKFLKDNNSTKIL